MLGPGLTLLVLAQAWHSRSSKFARQRLGFGHVVNTSSPLWIHCASVGEVTAALPLIRRLSGDFPKQGIVVSTTTPTGAETLLREKLQNVEHVFLPLDFKTAVDRALNSIQPIALILMETELWPHLVNGARDRKIPVAIVNARLSAKTIDAPAWIKPLYRQLLSRVQAIFAKSDPDASRFVSLGASADTVRVVGNIKYASVNLQQSNLPCDIAHPFWLAASTHEDEEEQLCSTLQQFTQCSKTLLVIAPRHPNRSEKIQQALEKSGVSYAVRSKNQTINSDTQVYLADRLGELKMWLAHAEVVFMGGSLVPVGGHNLLEPAAASLAMVTGPHLQNVSEEAELLLAANALYKASDVNEVLQRIEVLLADKELRKNAGQAGYDAVSDKASVLDDYVEALLPIISIKQ